MYQGRLLPLWRKGVKQMNYFNPGAFVSNFHYLVSGMLGIFLVIGIIILFTMLLNRVFRKK